MSSPTRRTVLTSLAGVTALGGCSSGPTEPAHSRTRSTDPAGTTASPTVRRTSTPTDAPTEPPTDTPTSISASDLEFVVAVVRQPSNETLGQIRASLTNHADGTLELSGGDPLPVGFDTLDARRVDAETPLALFPQQSDAVNDYVDPETGESVTIDDATYDGCWSIPFLFAHTAAGAGVTLPEGTTVAADYFPLAHRDAECPRGTYAAHGQMLVQSMLGWNQYVTTELQVRVDATGTLAVEGSMRVETP